MQTKTTSWEESGNKHVNLGAEARPWWPYHDVISDMIVKYSKPGASVLDIGCGRGQVSELVAKKGEREIYIADAYEACLEETSSIVDVKGTYLIGEEQFNITEKIPRTFDVVVMSHVLEHTYNPVAAVKDAMSLVSNGGHLILAVPNPARPNVLLGNIWKNHYVCRGHVVAWDMSHWINFLENILELSVVEYQHDFVQIRGCNKVKMIMSIGIWLRKLFPWWCFSNIAIIKK